MKNPGIKITRVPYEEPYHLNLHIEAANGHFKGALEYYCNATDLGKLGGQLLNYTGRGKEEIIYKLGSEKTEDNFAFFLYLRIYPVRTGGSSAVSIRLNNNFENPNGALIEFSIKAEVADLNRLGELLVGFGELNHLTLEWNITNGRLIV